MLKPAANKAAGERKPEARRFPPSHPELPRQLRPRLGYGEDLLRAENKVGGRFQHPLFGDRDELPDPRTESSRVTALNKYDTRPAESTDKPFTRCEAGYPSGRGFFNVV